MKKSKPIAPAEDANIFASTLAKTLENPVNLGIGTLPGHSYQPIDAQTYAAGREFLLNFLGIDDTNLSLIPVKGGGSGAISAGISALISMGYAPKSMSFSGWDWTGYDSFCYTYGLAKLYLPSSEYSSEDPDTLMMIQTNRNGDGSRLNLERAQKIIEENNRLNRPSFIDLPYFSGEDFEKEILQLFQEKAKTPTIIAWSPTKIFQTFAARPGGAVIVMFPSNEMYEEHRWVQSITARGTTGFDDAVTRELWEELAHNQAGLKERHAHYLSIIKASTSVWKENAPAAAAPYFDAENYGGMFRLFPAQSDTQARLADKNIVAVLMQYEGEYRLRVNLSGVILPSGEVMPGADEIIKTFFEVLNLK
ncbi:hypothetical protein GW756_01260 [bacterium]|nr:hypothetical protein [bacterium]NCQ54983.1 hypothetical protein [Candidatus Parcubacteria bacterium]NCS67027.1 hypothetical protein [Candidatus Peregrinibacteria bacterium]NCS95973.1 hypothetical protein [bacterium]